MSALVIISSYDELEKYLNTATIKQNSNIVVVVNHTLLIQYLKTTKKDILNAKKVFYIEPLKIANKFKPFFLLQTVIYLRRETKKILSMIKNHDIDQIVLLTDMMNGYSLFISNAVKKRFGVKTVLIPTLVHISRTAPSDISLKDVLRVLTYKCVFGFSIGLAKFRNQNILHLSPKIFDDIKIIPKVHYSLTDSSIPNARFRNNKSNKLLFMTQPLLKNNRVSEKNLKSFFNELRKVIEKSGYKLLLKLHPNDSLSNYDVNEGDLFGDAKEPSQHIDLSGFQAIMTFSSSSVLGVGLPIVSCINLIKFINENDQDAILSDFKRATKYEPELNIVDSWIDLENYLAKITSD